MTYLPITLTADPSAIQGCTDTSCGHWVGTPYYSGPFTLELEHAICAWASMWAVEDPFATLAQFFQEEWSGTADQHLLERYSR